MKTIAIAVVALPFALGVLAGCDQKGPAEKAGEAIDRTVERAGDKIEDATDRK
ncbi:MAG TPA: hypothetical protein VHG88_08170 [Burkholderiales bacterium]|nr:hypothetical protein [Burkholderiales bacterium]